MDHGLRELRLQSEPPVSTIGIADHYQRRMVQEFVIQGSFASSWSALGLNCADYPARIAQNVSAPRAERVSDRLQHTWEGRQPSPVLRWKVRPAVKRPALRRQEHRHRPTSVAGHCLHRRHVDRIDIRPLFPVYLDVHKQLVHQRRNLRVFERLPLHHVAPVARRISDAQQYRLVQ